MSNPVDVMMYRYRATGTCTVCTCVYVYSPVSHVRHFKKRLLACDRLPGTTTVRRRLRVAQEPIWDMAYVATSTRQKVSVSCVNIVKCTLIANSLLQPLSMQD
jgi:hypothetical protein